MAKLEQFQERFIQLALQYEALRFGEFTLKSGRVSPFFFNAGLFNSGAALAELGRCYADAKIHYGIEADCLFGPAYKGIPLAAVTAASLSSEHNEDILYCFNRKEAKAHGEGGTIVGAPLTGRALIVDDVITAGTAIREVIEIIAAHDAKTAAVLIGLDRQERGAVGTKSAIQEIEHQFGFPVKSIVTLSDIRAYIEQKGFDSELLARIDKYREQYGAVDSSSPA